MACLLSGSKRARSGPVAWCHASLGAHGVAGTQRGVSDGLSNWAVETKKEGVRGSKGRLWEVALVPGSQFAAALEHAVGAVI